MGLFGKSKKEREKEYMNKLDVPSCLKENFELIPELLLSMYIQKNEKQMVVDIKQSMLDLGYEEFPRNN